MALTTGTRLGPYQITALIGAGGMGEVWCATDVNLGRQVAIKVLPDAFAQDPDRLARFEREAKTLASLNHPNIAIIHGLEEADGIRALVMELVEGQTLADRIGRGPIPIDEALPIAKQIAAAVEAAHELGIIHRDLKPANIKLRPDGMVKVLDYGLAKATEPAGVMSSSQSMSPTITTPAMTQMGMILGTAAYMSPEQARGKPIDKRTDIWAFGCVVYEMLTGRRAFGGETVADVLVAVLEHEPDATALPESTPRALRRLVRRCLEKEPRRRLRDIGDARLEIDECSEPGESAGIATSKILVARSLEFQRITDFVGSTKSPVLSPDGKMVAFVAVVDGRHQIWIRMLAGPTLLQLTRDDSDHLFPRWAPDSNTLIYFTPGASLREEGTVFEVGALGGWPRPVTSSLGAADISHDGRRLALLRPAGDSMILATVARDGSNLQPVATLPAPIYSSLHWSPDDRWIAFQRPDFSAGFDVALEMVAIDTGERLGITRDSALNGFSWLPDSSGFVCSSSRGSTMLYPPVFNLRTITRNGGGDAAVTFGDDSYLEPDVHPVGSVVVSRVRTRSDIWKFSVSGSPAENTRNATRITRQTGHVQTPSVSPDGTRIVYISDNGGHANLWVATVGTSNPRQITFETDPMISVGVPVWSPRGDQIAFVINNRGQGGLWAVRPDGTALRYIVRGWAPGWSRDGRWLYYWRLGETSRRIEKISIEGGETRVVREDRSDILIPAVGDKTLYFVRPVPQNLSRVDLGDEGPRLGLWWAGAVTEFCRATPEDGTAEVIACVSGDRVPGAPGQFVAHVALSPDGKWLATSLIDGATTNLWVLSTAGGELKPVTDFGDRQTLICRSVSWSADSQYLYAAVAESQTDIVLVKGLIP